MGSSPATIASSEPVVQDVDLAVVWVHDVIGDAESLIVKDPSITDISGAFRGLLPDRRIDHVGVQASSIDGREQPDGSVLFSFEGRDEMDEVNGAGTITGYTVGAVKYNLNATTPGYTAVGTANSSGVTCG